MAFLYHRPEDVRQKIFQDFGGSTSPDVFGHRDEFQQDHLTEKGIGLLQWLGTGKGTRFYEENQWLDPVETIAILCFGADYDLFRLQWSSTLLPDLDAFYGPFRCNTFLPDKPVSDEFDCTVLKAVGVQFIYSPSQCSKQYRFGCEHPFIALFGELIAKKCRLPDRVQCKLSELLSDAEWRDLLCRYDALHHALLGAYFHSMTTGKHLLITNRW